MTKEERAAVRETLDDAHSAAIKAVERAAQDGALDPRRVAIAKTEIDKGFAVVSEAVRLTATGRD